MPAVGPSFLRRLLASASIDEADARSLVQSARALRHAGPAHPQRLKGRHIALLCAQADPAGARCLDRAARALGARVSRIEPGAGWPGDAKAARLFESLYDAVDVEDGPPGFAQRLQAHVGLPVFDGLASDDGPVLQLLPLLAPAAGAAPDDDDRCALVQAALIGVLA
jgi:ornithine carbamoyltransferase